MTEAVIVSTARTPIGRAFKGSLRTSAPTTSRWRGQRRPGEGARASTRRLIEDLYLGCARPPGEQGSNLARVVSGPAGLRPLPGATINRFCASSVQTTRMAYHAIKAGEGDIFVSGGVECVSQYTNWAAGRLRPATTRTRGSRPPGPAASRSPRTTRPGPTRAPRAWSPTSTSRWARPPRTSPPAYGVPRARQDECAVPVQTRREGHRRRVLRARDRPGHARRRHRGQHGRRPPAGVTLEAVAGPGSGLPARDGTITAGNCCPLNDGAAAVVVMSDRKVRDLDLRPGRVVSTA